jgi:glucuronoarabinoxylan endo-1,4-beta-xylanase
MKNKMRFLLLLLLLWPSIAFAQTATIDATQKFQVISGFGAAVGFGCPTTDANGECTVGPTLTSQECTLLYDKSAGIGLSLLRVKLEENGTFPYPTHTSCAVTNGAQVWLAPWSAPANLKSNNDIKNGGFLCAPGSSGGTNNNCTNTQATAYQTWATQITNYILSMQNTKGIPIYAVSVQNEPDFVPAPPSYESMQWNAGNFDLFVKTYLGPTLAANGLGNVKIMISEQAHWLFDLTATANSDASANAFVGIYAAHGYNTSAPGAPPPPTLSGSQQLWETEDANLSTDSTGTSDALSWVFKLHNFLTTAQVNAWHYWQGVNVFQDGTGQGILTETSTGVLGPIALRYYYIGQFTKFIRPGMQRISAAGSNCTASLGVCFDAYTGLNGATNQLVIVAQNEGSGTASLTLNLTGLSGVSSVTPTLSDGGANKLTPQAPITVTAGSFAYGLPAHSVVTFVGTISSGGGGGGNLIVTPGWHPIPSTAVCGGGAESNATYVDPANFPNNLNSAYPSYLFNFPGNCSNLIQDSNSSVMDTFRHRLLIWGGGHQHYWGNDFVSLELNNIGTASPSMFHLNHSGNPNSCPTTGGPPSGQVIGPNGSICNYNAAGNINTVIAFDKCTYVANCTPTVVNPGSVHTYNGLVYIPPPFDEVAIFGGASAPQGNALQTAWLVGANSILASCAPNLTTNQQGCNPSWVGLGTPANNNFFSNAGGVGVIAAWDPNAQGVWVQTQNSFNFFNPTTNVLTQKTSTGIGYHSNGVIDPIDQYFIYVGPCANGVPGNGPNGCTVSGPEGILYVSVANGSTFTLNHPVTTGCATITTPYNGTSLPAAQYQGVVWDPISRRVVIYPNGGNVIWFLDPHTWTCTSETYGSTQGTDFPQNSPLASSADGTFRHFDYDPSMDVFVLCNDWANDCWYLHLMRGNAQITNNTGSTQTNVPVTLPQPIVQGRYPQCLVAYQDSSGSAVPVAFTQNDVKNRWPDGSFKFGMVSFILPTIASGQTVNIDYNTQACPAQTPLTQAQMLAAGFNFDGQIQLTGAVSPPGISARSILTAAGSCSDPGTDPDGSTSLCKYWLKGPVVTAVVLEDRSGRTFDVNTDGGAGNPLHPIFEAWFYPQTNQFQLGYTLENAWASTTATLSARPQTFSLVLTAGNTSPITLSGNWGAASQSLLTRAAFHRTYCSNGTQNTCSPLTINHNYRYIAQTRFTPNWDPNLVLNPTYVAAQVTAFNNASTSKGLAGTNTGIGFYPGPNSCGGSNSGTTGDGCSAGGFNQTGAGYFHGPLTTWAIICLLTSDPTECGTVMLGNADLGYEIPYFYREADQPAGHGGFFDAPNNTVTTRGRVVSINARTQLNMQDATIQTGCNTLFAADWVNFGGTGQNSGVFSGETGTSHWADLAYVAYLFTGQYAYYEEQVMQAAYSIGQAGDLSPGSRACTQPTSNSSLRMGAAGYWQADQERGNDWQGLMNAKGAFLAVDGSPEKAYFTDKLRANIAVWEGAHSITCDVPGTGVFQPYCGGSGNQTAWSYGNSSRILNTNQSGTPLGSWAKGVSNPSPPPAGSYATNYPICGSTTGAGGPGNCPTVIDPNVATFANSNFQNAYSAVTIGWINDMGFCPQTGGVCAIQQYVANHFINEAMNPASNPFHLSDYVYPTEDASGGPITTWAENQSLYFAQGASWAGCPSGTTGGADEWYTAEDMSAMSYFTGLSETFSGNNYSGQSAYNVIRGGSGIASCLGYFSSTGVAGFGSPKWSMVPRTGNVGPSGGGGGGGSVTLAPASLAFGTIPQGTTSSGLSLTLSNTSGSTITISGIVPNSSNDSDFAQTNTCGATLGNGSTCTISVTFSPSASVGTNETGTITVSYSGAVGSPLVTSLTGTSGNSGAITLSCSPTPCPTGTLGYGTQASGSTSGAQVITATSSGTGSVTLAAANALTNTNPTNFTITGTTCTNGLVLAPTNTCTITITFTPNATGLFSAQISLSDSAAGSPQVVQLTGSGSQTLPAVGLFAANLAGCITQTVTAFCFTADGHIYVSVCGKPCSAFALYQPGVASVSVNGSPAKSGSVKINVSATVSP